MDINTAAAVITRDEILIHAPVENHLGHPDQCRRVALVAARR